MKRTASSASNWAPTITSSSPSRRANSSPACAPYCAAPRAACSQPGLLRAGRLEIDLHGHRALLDDEPLHLTRIEFKLLAFLAQHPGQAFSRQRLLEHLHGHTHDGFDRSIDAHIKNLRRKIEPDLGDPTYILTVYGLGYRFNDEAGA